MQNILKIPEDNKVHINKLTKIFSSTFKERVVFLGLHGSSRFDSLSPDYVSDIDLELILDVINPEDLKSIRNIIFQVPVKVECQARSIYEIKNPLSLIHRTEYKIFMYHAYANSITLLGENVYKDLILKFTDEQYKRSLLINIQLAWKDIRKKYFSKKDAWEINKLIEVFLFDILLYMGKIDYKELDKKKIFEAKRYNVYNISKDTFSEILSEKELQILTKHSHNHVKKIFDLEILYSLEKILRFLEKTI